LEMAVKPPDASLATYSAYFWLDGLLLGKTSLLTDPAPMLDTTANLQLSLEMNSKGPLLGPFSGEIDDLVIGVIAPEKIKE